MAHVLTGGYVAYRAADKLPCTTGKGEATRVEVAAVADLKKKLMLNVVEFVADNPVTTPLPAMKARLALLTPPLLAKY